MDENEDVEVETLALTLVLANKGGAICTGAGAKGGEECLDVFPCVFVFVCVDDDVDCIRLGMGCL